ncbi:hypothetical protein [Bowmanella dokdonensis]|uniref:Uncharacterized protein n=1 Tax=Bowmanella dokdonensis TaxID=751969 RepID=A0A939ISD8_9ALTE|nr:hypothetical protein [Bowmanella dokdonensis]MBN7826321.1 hypothetical protein [Bowmanella dokdonensis]
MSEKETLFALWLEDDLNDEQLAEFRQLCADDDEFAARVALGRDMQHQAKHYQQAEVPRWVPPAIGAQSRSGSPWGWAGFAPLSFATSLLAIVMVLLRVEVQVQNNALTLSFAGQGRQAEIEQAVAAQLDDFRQQQQVALVDYARDLRDQQQQANTQLASYLLTSSRTERREDFAELIKFVNQQRADDQVFYARQLNKLEQELYSNTETTPVTPGSDPNP